MSRAELNSPAEAYGSRHIANPPVSPILDDADGDIAALVYAPDDRPDVVLCDFARHVRNEGRQVCGLVQLRDRKETGPRRTLVALDDWRTLDVPRTAGGGDARRFHIDGQRIDDMARRIESEIARGTDLVVASRFGPLELAGRGFCRAIRIASETQTPLVIAVPSSAFERWTRVTGGMAARIGCRLDDTLAWWSSLARSRDGAGRTRICELVK